MEPVMQQQPHTPPTTLTAAPLQTSNATQSLPLTTGTTPRWRRRHSVLRTATIAIAVLSTSAALACLYYHRKRRKGRAAQRQPQRHCHTAASQNNTSHTTTITTHAPDNTNARDHHRILPRDTPIRRTEPPKPATPQTFAQQHQQQQQNHMHIHKQPDSSSTAQHIQIQFRELPPDTPVHSAAAAAAKKKQKADLIMTHSSSSIATAQQQQQQQQPVSLQQQDTSAVPMATAAAVAAMVDTKTAVASTKSNATSSTITATTATATTNLHHIANAAADATGGIISHSSSHRLQQQHQRTPPQEKPALITHGPLCGEVTMHTAVLWARANGPGPVKFHVKPKLRKGSSGAGSGNAGTLASNNSSNGKISVTAVARPENDFVVKVELCGLRAATQYQYWIASSAALVVLNKKRQRQQVRQRQQQYHSEQANAQSDIKRGSRAQHTAACEGGPVDGVFRTAPGTASTLPFSFVCGSSIRHQRQLHELWEANGKKGKEGLQKQQQQVVPVPNIFHTIRRVGGYANFFLLLGDAVDVTSIPIGGSRYNPRITATKPMPPEAAKSRNGISRRSTVTAVANSDDSDRQVKLRMDQVVAHDTTTERHSLAPPAHTSTGTSGALDAEGGKDVVAFDALRRIRALYRANLENEDLASLFRAIPVFAVGAFHDCPHTTSRAETAAVRRVFCESWPLMTEEDDCAGAIKGDTPPRELLRFRSGSGTKDRYESSKNTSRPRRESYQRPSGRMFRKFRYGKLAEFFVLDVCSERQSNAAARTDGSSSSSDARHAADRSHADDRVAKRVVRIGVPPVPVDGVSHGVPRRAFVHGDDLSLPPGADDIVFDHGPGVSTAIEQTGGIRDKDESNVTYSVKRGTPGAGERGNMGSVAGGGAESESAHDGWFSSQRDLSGVPLLGVDQLAWLKNSLINSTAVWKIIVSSIPLTVYPEAASSLRTKGTAESVSTLAARLGISPWSCPRTARARELHEILASIHENEVKRVVFITQGPSTGVLSYDPWAEGQPSFYEFMTGPLTVFSKTLPSEDASPRPPTRPASPHDRPNALRPHFLHGPSSRPSFGLVEFDERGALTYRMFDHEGSQTFVHTFV